MTDFDLTRSPTDSRFTRRRLLAGAGAGALRGALPPRPAARGAARSTSPRATCSRCRSRCRTSSAGTPAEADTAHNVTAGHHQQSAAQRPVRADRSAGLHREDHQHRRACRASPTGASINAQALVTGRITRQGDGRLKAEFRLWDVFAGQQLDGKQYFTTPDNWRRIAHIISDAIYERLTGEKGYFDSRIVFVDETGPKDRRIKRLAIMDQDGAGVRYLTRGDDLVLTPRFNPSTQEITYMSYGQGEPRVYLLNIETGQREIVGNFPGMTFAPRFSPDGQRVIMSLQQGGNSNLFVMDLRSKQTTRLTDTPAIDTAPCYSPDGRSICFESDRGGTQQIYVMAASGGPAQRISFGEGIYSTPVWSPRGDYIAFTGQARGQFSIGIIKPDGSGERILTEGFHNEGPTFAPNGRVLMFFRDPGATRPVALYDRHHRPQRAARCRRRASPRIRPGRRC